MVDLCLFALDWFLVLVTSAHKRQFPTSKWGFRRNTSFLQEVGNDQLGKWAVDPERGARLFQPHILAVHTEKWDIPKAV